MNHSAEAAALLPQIIDVLAGIAPEARDLALDPDVPLREQLDLDSMDHLHFTIALHERFGVDIPEADYATMHRLTELADYIAARRTG
jgi:acyl carrier protein